MFVGHYSTAFIAKAVEPRIPLWVLLLAAQLVDVIWVGLVLAGVEIARLDPSLASNPLDLHYMPYTHSLLAAGLWATAAGVVTARTPRFGGTRRAGLAVAGVVLSHWLLDLLVHRPDLTLWGAPPKLGLALWNAPALAYLLELGLLAGCAGLYVVHRSLSPRAARGVAVLVGGLALLQTAVSFGPIPTSLPAMVLSVGVVFVVVAYAGARTER